VSGSESESIFRNTAAQSAPVVTSFLFSFLLAPVMLSRLGLAQFGVWAVTGALAQYIRLLDLGVTGSLARFVAMYDARGDRASIEQTIGVGLIAGLVVGAVSVLAAIVAAPLVSDVLGVLDSGEMRIVLVSSAVVSTSYLVCAVISSVPVGLRRMGPPNVAETAANVVNFVVSLIALLISTDVTDYAVANAVAGVIGILFALIALRRVWPAPLARVPGVAHARGILSFGVKSQLVNLAQLVNVQTDKLIIAAMLGPRTAGAYDIGNRVVQGVLSLSLMTLSAMIPTATADIVKRGHEVIVEYLTRYTTRALAIGWPLLGALCVSAPYLLIAWLGETPPDTTAIIALLSAAFAVSLSTGVPMTLVVSDGHPGLVAQTAALVVVLNLSATLAAAPLFGLWGVLIATVGADVIATVIFAFRFHRRYELAMRLFVGAIAPPAAVTLLTAVPFAAWYLVIGVNAPGRGLALVGVFATGGVYLVSCWLIESRYQLLPGKLTAQGLVSRLRRRHIMPANEQ
jgi:O-antigen/teichoic acid export membrane protein